MINYYKSILYVVLTAFTLLFTYSNNALAANSLATASSMNFLVLTDIHYRTNKTPSVLMEIFPDASTKWDDNLLDKPTFNMMLDQIQTAITKKTITKPDFILILGDLSGYELDNITIYHDIKTVLQGITKKLSQKFSIPIILVFGNNDSLSAEYGPLPTDFDYGPFKATTTSVNGTRSTYEIAKKKIGWKNGFLSTGTKCSTSPDTYPCLINENSTYGYFSTYLAPNLRLLALNSVTFANTKHNNAPLNVGSQELVWLARELKTAARKGNKVLIASHVPSGNDLYYLKSNWNDASTAIFQQLLSNYQNTIIGILTGHTHMEELKVLQNTAGDPVGAEISTAGITTIHGNAPSVKTFYLSKDQNQEKSQWAISDYISFNFAPKHPQTNPSGAGDFHLRQLYDFNRYYCTANQQNFVQCLSSVTTNMTGGTGSMFANYLYQEGNNRYIPTVSNYNGIYIPLPVTTIMTTTVPVIPAPAPTPEIELEPEPFSIHETKHVSTHDAEPDHDDSTDDSTKDSSNFGTVAAVIGGIAATIGLTGCLVHRQHAKHGLATT